MVEDMEEIISFFNKNTIGFLATIDENMPRVRPWTFLFEEDGKIWFITSTKKHVYKELNSSPFIEFCSYSKDYICGRIGGKIQFSKDLDENKKILSEHPNLKKMYDTMQFDLFYLEHGQASLRSIKLGIDKHIEF